MYNVTVRYKGKEKFKPFLSSCAEAVLGPFHPASLQAYIATVLLIKCQVSVSPIPRKMDRKVRM